MVYLELYTIFGGRLATLGAPLAAQNFTARPCRDPSTTRLDFVGPPVEEIDMFSANPNSPNLEPPAELTDTAIGLRVGLSSCSRGVFPDLYHRGRVVASVIQIRIERPQVVAREHCAELIATGIRK